MIVCHAIAAGDELTCVKFMSKVSLNAIDFPNDEIPKRLLRLFAGKPFAESKSQLHTKELRAALNEALHFAIECKREVFAFDYCQFTRERGSQLTIGETELQRLIRGGMYELIQTLIASNCLYAADARSMDVDDLFAAQQINGGSMPRATDVGPGGGGPRGGGTPMDATPAQAKESPTPYSDAYEGGEADKEKDGAANKNGDAKGDGAEPSQEAKQRSDDAEAPLTDGAKPEGDTEKKPRRKKKRTKASVDQPEAAKEKAQEGEAPAGD